ncbi:Abi family protein [Micromonospora sp. DT81.3]|uniref:Abi family protein n=1 Tax=Micromonospora sp. DT81.3 TaxID=3416523 RepID=UPI003CF86EA6
MGQPYTKPFLTVSEQVDRLTERGLDIGTAEYATSLLQRVGYYRLSGYWHLFRELEPSPPGTPTVEDETARPERRKSTFVAGSTLSTVHKIYDFDRALRIRIFAALEMVEVSLRFRIGHMLGRSHAYAHRDPAHLLPEFTGHTGSTPELVYSRWLDSNHAEWLREVDREENRSNETFVAHFTTKYGGPLPVWVVTEILSFGTLSRLYSGMERAHQDRIAAAFGILNSVPNGDGSLTGNWLNHLRYIRNTCAHHARLWNKNITVQLAEPTGIPELAHLTLTKTRSRIYGTLAVLAFLTERIHPGNGWRTDTLQFVCENIDRLGLNLTLLGFPAQWDTLDIWQTHYTPSHHDWDQKQELLDQLQTIPAGEAGRVLRPEEDQAKRLKWVRYLRDKGFLLGLRLATAYEYPDFQLDPATGNVHPIISTANSRLLGNPKTATPENADAARWAAARWWTTTPPASDHSPVEQFVAGELTLERLDQMLPPTQ